MGGLLPHHLILSVSPFDGIYGTAHLGIKLLTQLVPDLLPVWGNLGKHQESLQGSLQELSSRLFCQMLATLQIKPRALYISECVCQNPVTSCVSLGLCPPSLPPSPPPLRLRGAPCISLWAPMVLQGEDFIVLSLPQAQFTLKYLFPEVRTEDPNVKKQCSFLCTDHHGHQ